MKSILDRLDEMAKRREAATPGPWKIGCLSGHNIGKRTVDHRGEFDDIIESIHATGPGHSDLEEDQYKKVIHDAAFIAASRTEHEVLEKALRNVLNVLGSIKDLKGIGAYWDARTYQSELAETCLEEIEALFKEPEEK